MLNLGVGGYGTAQQLLALQEEGLRYRPDLVVLAFYLGNDVSNNSYALEAALVGAEARTTFARPYARAAALDAELEWTPPDAVQMAPYFERWSQRNSTGETLRRALQPAMLAHLVEKATAQIWARFASRDRNDPDLVFGWPFRREVADAQMARLWREAWFVTRRLLLEADRVARAAGARLVLLLVPTEFQVDPRALEAGVAAYPGIELDPLRINRELAAFAAGAGIPLLDPTPALAAEQAAGRPIYYAIEDHHWNAAGHALVTQLLAKFLDERGLLPPAP